MERMTTRERVAAIESSIGARVTRVRKRAWPAFQIGLAAGLAFWIAHTWVGHKQPFFAPISVVLIMGFSGGERINRAFDMSLGCVLGVLIGDLLFAPLGPGGWQIALAVGVSLLFASFFSKSVLVANQAAIGSILIQTIMPPGAEVTGIDRTIDAIIGSAVGLVVVALVPPAPLASARTEIANVLKVLSSVLDDVSTGLSTQHTAEMALALESIRGTQAGIDALAAATKSGQESTKLSPFLWRSRRHAQSLARMVTPTDNAIRTTRVLARRALVLVSDRDTVSDKQLWILDELSVISLELAEIFEVNAKVSQAEGMPAIVNHLRDIAAETGLDVLDPAAQRPASVGDAEDSPENFSAKSVEESSVKNSEHSASTRIPVPEDEDAAAYLSVSDGAPTSDADEAAASAPAGYGPSSENVLIFPNVRPALSAAVILAQSRSLIVDLLQICGWSRESAIAVLAPTSETPAFTPEVRRRDNRER